MPKQHLKFRGPYERNARSVKEIKKVKDDKKIELMEKRLDIADKIMDLIMDDEFKDYLD